MTTFDGTVQEANGRFARGRRLPNVVTLGRWVNPVLGLGALVLTGYLLIGNPVTPDATMLAPRSHAQLAATQVTAQLARGNETGSITPSSVAPDESTGSSMTHVLSATLGTVLAAAWVMGGAWVGIHSARISTPLDEPKSDLHLRSAASSDGQASH
ncbi:MAG TPA: hypothetical protein VKG22_00645 [Stellaceae bacterium]|nr:hypothetical protein [Stellaceae bacterium]HMD65142.1 hypothetical protein [Stellaceae bacterium]